MQARPIASVVLVALTLLALPVAPAEAGTARTYRYLAGSHVPTLVVIDMVFDDTGGHCTMEDKPLVAPDGASVYPGGVCFIPVEPGRVAIEVVPEEGYGRFRVQVDAPFDPVVDGVGAAPPPCARGAEEGSLLLDVPEGCPTVSVWVMAGALSGSIAVTQLDP